MLTVSKKEKKWVNDVIDTFDDVENFPDVDFNPFYVNMSIFIRWMLCKLTAIFIWIIYEKIRQVKCSTLFSKLNLPIVRC